MSEMLRFAPERRPPADHCVNAWHALLKPWIPGGQVEDVDVAERRFQDIVAYLNAALRGSAGMSSLQWERVVRAMEEIEPKLDPAKTSTWHDLRKKVAEMRETVAV